MMTRKRTVITKARGRLCPYCGCKMLNGQTRPTRDHLFPKAKGGSFVNGMRIMCCWKCNNDKADMTLEEFTVAMESCGDPRAAHLKAFVEKPITGWNFWEAPKQETRPAQSERKEITRP
jgi:5-methylcytosine-specific restriction endonuclease McrA